MKVLFTLALVLATTSALDLNGNKMVSPVAKKEGRISNGNLASAGQFPYQVGLYVTEGFLFPYFWCGGSLIGHQWILTAASCTHGVYYQIIVLLGGTERTKFEASITVDYRNFIIHSGWNKVTRENDIALIKIPPVTLSRNLQIVKLPAIASSYSTYSNEYAIATGWGGARDLANNLQYARMLVISKSSCQIALGSSFVPESAICVNTTAGASNCNGDSGGPLVLESDKVQIGLIPYSPSSSCANANPAVFTRLTSYLNWIHSNTGIAY